MKNKINKNGFTLFELLVSISIIGILTAVAVVAYSGAQKKARDVRRIEDLKLIQTAAEQYYSSNNYSYPTSYTVGASWTNADGTVILESYPHDPKGINVLYNCFGSGCGDGSGYCVCVSVENTANANSGPSCAFTAASKNSFCVKNQQ